MKDYVKVLWSIGEDEEDEQTNKVLNCFRSHLDDQQIEDLGKDIVIFRERYNELSEYNKGEVKRLLTSDMSSVAIEKMFNEIEGLGN